MKPIEAFLAELRRRDIKVWAEGDQLCLDAPKGALDSKLRAELIERKGEMLAFLNKVAPKSTERERIQPVERTGNPPLSFAQQRLWFLNQLEGPSASYNIKAAVEIRGTLDEDALTQAFNEMICRHEVLRTTFPALNGEPMQAIAPVLRLPLNVVDLQHLPAQEQNAAVKELVAEHAQQPFDLAKGPLLRVNLFKLTSHDETSLPGRYVLLVTMHHIIADGWSIGVFIKESTALYAAFVTGKPSPLPPLAVQYADFAHWQRQRLRGETLERALDFWRQQMAGAPELTQLPLDRPRPSVQAFLGAAEPFGIQPDLLEEVRRQSQKLGVTLFMTLHTALVTLLYRYSGQEDIVIGAPIANRNHAETEPLIGLFANFLLLRADLSGNPSFQTLLHDNRERLLAAYAHQDVPFEKLVETLQPKRVLSYTPFLQVALVMNNTPSPGLGLPGIDVTLWKLENTRSPHDLLLSLTETDTELRGDWVYNTEIFEATTIQRIDAHYQHLLTQIVADPTRRLLDFEIENEATPQAVDAISSNWDEAEQFNF